MLLAAVASSARLATGGRKEPTRPIAITFGL